MKLSEQVYISVLFLLITVTLQNYPWNMIFIHDKSHNDLFHGLFVMGNIQKSHYEWERRIHLTNFAGKTKSPPSKTLKELSFCNQIVQQHQARNQQPRSWKLLPPLQHLILPLGPQKLFSMGILPVKNFHFRFLNSANHGGNAQHHFLRATDTPISRLPEISIYYPIAPTTHSHALHTFVHFSQLSIPPVFFLFQDYNNLTSTKLMLKAF